MEQLCVRSFSEKTTKILRHKKCERQEGHLPTILYIPQQSRGQIEEIPIYPGVMVAIEWLVFSVRERSAARVYNCSKRGIARDSIKVESDIRG